MTCCNGAIARVIPISLMLSKAEKRLGGVKLIYKVHRKNVVYFVCAFEDSVQVPTVVLLTSDAVLWVAPLTLPFWDRLSLLR